MPGDTDVELLLNQQDWKAITMRLTLFAYGRLGRQSMAEAEDVAHTAITRIWDPGYKDWNPTHEPDLIGHLRSVVNGIVSNIWKSARQKKEHATSPEKLARHEGAADDHSVDGKIDAAGFLDQLLERVDGDELVAEIVFAMSDGIDRPSEQAIRLKRDRKDVYKARRRLDGHVAHLRETLGVKDNDGV